jgi:hypothetical protein
LVDVFGARKELLGLFEVPSAGIELADPTTGQPVSDTQTGIEINEVIERGQRNSKSYL